MAYLTCFLRWLSLAAFLWLAKAFTYVTAPITAFFIVRADEHAITGFPSYIDGFPREFLIPLFRWQQTHDAPVDEYFMFHYKGVRDGAFIRYWCRVLWIWRNNSYGLAHNLGLDQSGIKSLGVIKTAEWRGNIGYHLEIAKNCKGQVLFELKGQTKRLEYRLGYGIHRYSPKSKAILYARLAKRK